MTRTLDQLADRNAGKGCRACGSRATAGVVRIEARAYGSQGSLKGGRTVASRSVSLCEPCLVARYEAAEAALTGADQ